ncbi:uncharacterized protein [Rutidosis leptorrhynchoides]|uniref:uncharacterized protein n=1 Tax=Rutidosis leptorrhynchoides TaxID=125765 RepID=UPI003A993030
MKVLSLNERGMGVNGKFGWVKNICSCERPDVVALQETRCSHLEDSWVFSLWGNCDCGFVQKEAVGKSSGMLLIWDTKSFSATSALSSNFFLAVRRNWIGSSQELIIVNVYGPHEDANKKLMWDALDNIMKGVDIPWLLWGDFNEVREHSDRMNCVFHQRWATRFNDFIIQNNLIKIPIIGQKFTRSTDDGTKFSKIDRFLVSDKFINLWKGLSVIALDRRESDHCPLILRDKLIDYGPKPFKVFNEWLDTEGVESIIQTSWDKVVTSTRRDCKFRDHLKNVKFALKDWSNQTFGKLDSDIWELKMKATEWGQKAEAGPLNDTERVTWLDARRCWLEK